MFDPILGDILAIDEMIDRRAEEIAKERGIEDPVEARMEAIADSRAEQRKKTTKEIIDLFAQKRDVFMATRDLSKEEAIYDFLFSQGWDGIDMEKAKEIADKFICEEHPDGTISFKQGIQM